MSKPRKIEGTLVYSPDDVQPEDLLTFIELPGFGDDWKHLRLNDDDLWMLQFGIMADPRSARVVPRTDGLRKLRFGRTGGGKSGGFRSIHYFMPGRGLPVFLMTLFAKNAKANLTPTEEAALAMIGERIAADYGGRK